MQFYYHFIDKALVDPILDLSWRQFLRRHPKPDWTTEGGTEGFIEFVFDEPPDPREVRWILENKTLRWTLHQSNISQYFLSSVIGEVPAVSRGCPVVWPECVEEAIVVLAAATDAYLKGRLSRRVMTSALLLTAVIPDEWLTLTKKESRIIMEAFPLRRFRPIFESLSDEQVESKYTWLTTAATRRYMDFLQEALAGNWPAPRIVASVREAVSYGLRHSGSICMKDIALPSALLAAWRRRRFVTPFLVKCWEY